jgi:hypothetical protein
LAFYAKNHWAMEKSRKTHLLISLFLLVGGHWFAAYPCTTFVLHRGNELVLGRNLDWHTGTGLILANQRGLEKTALIDAPEKPVKWTSKFGSITFNQVGRELPYGGMNEAGLVVEHMTLDKTAYPAKDDRPAINACQWIQFQLDNYSTVDEVIKSDGLLRIVDAQSHFHFLVCDGLGRVAAIEFLNGKMMSYMGKNLPVAALANSTYAESLHCLQSGQSTATDRSLYNFTTAAHGVNQFGSTNTDATVQYAFDTLSAVSQGVGTKWSIVYDVQNLRVHVKVFETPTLVGDRVIFLKKPGETKIKIVDIKGFDFNCLKPAKLIDLESSGEGVVNDRFKDYTTALNKESIAKAFKFLAKMKVFPPMPDETVDGLARYPESFRCGAAR